MKNPALHNIDKDQALYNYLVQRVGKAHLRQRLGVEMDHEADRFGQGQTFFNIENWKAGARIIRLALKLTGLAGRGRSNALDFRIRHNYPIIPNLPEAFDGFTVLQLSDLHFDSLEEFPEALAEKVECLDFDICVMTGDYRFLTYGSHEKAMMGLERFVPAVSRDTFAVLGNHDSITMTQPMENLGVRLLINENVCIEREGHAIYLAGIDDPHYFSADNLEKAYQGIPDESVSVLLSHTPEIYRHAAHVGFDFMMCGHTHGGQICLPGGIAITYNSSAPRFTGVGHWSYDLMLGYTSAGTGSSVVPARFNCPPEITLHHLSRSGTG